MSVVKQTYVKAVHQANVGSNEMTEQLVLAQPFGSNIKIFCLKRGSGSDFQLKWVKEVEKNTFQKYFTELLARYMALKVLQVSTLLDPQEVTLEATLFNKSASYKPTG